MKPTLFLLSTLAAASLLAADASKAESPAKVGKVLNETSLNTVTLTPDATRRLGIKTVALERKQVIATRLLGGTVMALPGAQITLAAPLTGTLQSLSKDAPLRVGASVRKGQPLFALAPLLAPEVRANLANLRTDAEAELQRSKAQLEVAKNAAQRAVQLLKDGAGSQRSVEETRAAVQSAEATIKAADLRVRVLSQALAPNATSTPVTVEAPFDGLIRQLHTSAGQQVNAGVALVEIYNGQRVWLRVPVYVGDVAGLDLSAEARAGRLVPTIGETMRAAKPISGPQTASEASATVDLYYEVGNADGALQPGQRMSVTVPLRGQEDALVVPWNAVVHDVNGGQWVYEQVATDTFARSRIEVQRVDGATAVLARGPKAGTLVVTDGVAELFGTEFGTGK